MYLALDIGFTCFPLGMEGIKFKVQIVFGRFAGVDGTADGRGPAAHAALSARTPLLPCSSRKPKNLGPFQLVPVMIFAMAERLE